MQSPLTSRPHAAWRTGRRLAIEQLEDRHMLSGLPFGAAPDDTAEYMLGDVAVTLVLMESDGSIDANTEDWTPEAIQAVKSTVAEGLTWWEDTLALEGSVHELNFIINTTYADSPVPTGYEPITRSWDAYQYWVEDFLQYTGFSTPAGLAEDIRAFNHAQREAYGTDWSFTIFVANSTNDPDDRFELGHEFAGSFAFAGGLFFVMPSERPASTVAHETGHIFYAKDEYAGGASYYDTRGYYDTQNTNAWDDNPNLGSRVDSIMSAGAELQNAYANHQVSPSAKAMIGWLDSDGDGVYDVLDVPLTLQGSGALDPYTQTYRFFGSSAVQTLPNLNPSGLGNDITLNEISRVEYRFDGGDWQTAGEYHAATAQLDLTIPVPAGAQQIEIRTIDDASGETSEVFSAAVGRAESTELPGINGFVWIDVDGDGLRELGEPGASDWTVVLKQSDGTPLPSPQVVEPDDYSAGTVLDSPMAGTTLSVETVGGFDCEVGVAVGPAASTGEQVFAYRGGTTWSTLWTSDSRRLRIDFTTPVSRLQIDAVSDTGGDFGRLEVFDSSGQLLARYTSGILSAGQSETLEITRPTADVAYALVGGHMGSSLMLDNLRIGVCAETTTDDLGAFTVAGLDPGTYLVELVSRQGWINTSPQGGQITVVPGAGAVLSGVDFAVNTASGGSLWRNPVNPLDVDDDGAIAPRDVLWIANYLYFKGARQLPAPTIAPNMPAPYLDVNGDGYVSPVDALLVVHGLLGSAGGSTSGEAQWEISEANASGDQGVAGETIAADDGAAPANAADSSSPALLAEALADSPARPGLHRTPWSVQPSPVPRGQADPGGLPARPPASAEVHRQASAQRDGGVPGKTCDGLVSAPRESAETTDAAGLTDGLFSNTSWLEDLLPAALGEAPIMGRFGI